MSELLFVTVGTTAIGNPLIGEGNLPELARQYLNPQKTEADKDRLEHRFDLSAKLIEAHIGFWKSCEAGGFNPDDFEKTSAELTSTMALLEQEQSITGVVFLGSETPEGRLATKINYAVLKEIWTRGKTSQKIVPGLEKKFTRVTPELEAILAEYRASSAACVHFNITGGFKGVIPSITFLATQHPGWSIYYQFQGMNKAAKVFFSRATATAPLVPEEKEMDW